MSENDSLSGPASKHGLPLHDDFSCRADQLDALRRDFRAVMGDSPEAGGPARPICFVRGASGAGKSRLVAELRAEADHADVRVEEVFCYERQGVPFLPILRAVKDLLLHSDSAQRIWSRHSPVLARVFPDLVESLGEPPARVELSGLDGKIQLFDAIARLLGEFSREKPLLLVIHDIHRSDPGTIDFLEYLGRNVMLDDASRRPAAADDPQKKSEDWKQVRPPEEERGSFITTTLTGGDSAMNETVTGRLFIVVNALHETKSEDDEAPTSESPTPDEVPAEMSATSAPAVDPTIDARLEELSNSPIVHTLELGALDVRETEALVERTLGSLRVTTSAAERIHEVTGGNPLFVVEICRALLEEGFFEGKSSTAAIDVPEKWFSELASGDESAVRALVKRRLASLSKDERDLANVLATMRRPVQFNVLESIVEGSAAEVRTALTGLQSRDFVRVVRDRDTERFFLVHEAYMRTLSDGLEDDDRREVHGRIARTLAGHAGEPVRTFEYYEHQRQSADVAESVAAGLASMRYFARAYAPQLAAEIGEKLLEEIAKEDGAATPADERAALRLEIAKIHLRCGEVLTAKSRAKEFIDDSRELPGLARLDGYLTLADCYLQNGEAHKGIKVLARGEKIAHGEIDKRTGARLSARHARLRLERQDPKRAINRCSTSLKDLGDESEFADERALLLDVLATARLAKGETSGAIQNLQQLLEVTEELGDPHRLAEVLRTLGRVYYDRGNYFRAARYLFRGIDAARQAHDPRALTRIHDMLGKVYRNSGDTLRGIDYFNRSLRLRERIGDLEGMSRTLNSLGSLHAHSGDYYRAIRFFQRSVQNAERFGDTGGIVRAFLHLGRVFFQIGEFRQVESLAKQILILSQEFNFVELEGEGHRLQGDLTLARGDFKQAERMLRKGLEIAQKRGRESSQVSAMLSLGQLLAEKDENEAALKLASKAQILAEELQSVPHQVRAQLLRGNIYRVLKGGSVERAKECFGKGIELVSGDIHTPLLFELDYSIAKVFQENLEFAEAHESYRRAQQSIDDIASRMPEDFRVAFLDDRRRRTFADDYARFEKEAAGRPTDAEELDPQAGLTKRDEPVPQAPAEQAAEIAQLGILESATRIGLAESSREWSRLLLEEARKAVSATSGFVARANGGAFQVLAFHNLPSEMGWAAAGELPGALARDVTTGALPIRSGDSQWNERVGRIEGASAYRSRSILVMPIRDAFSVCGVLYLERPSAQNPFDRDDLLTLERLTRAVAGPFRTLQRLDALLHVAHSELMTVPGLEERLPEMIRSRFEDGVEFALLEVQCVGIDARIDEIEQDETTRDMGEDLVSPGGVTSDFVVYIGANTLAYGFIGDASENLEKVEATLVRAFEEWRDDRNFGDTEVQSKQLRLEEPTTDESDVVRRVWAELFRRRTEFDLDSEIGALTGGELSLKEAKSALERRYITAELHKSRGNITRAAESLGVHRPQLSSLLKKHNVRREDFE